MWLNRYELLNRQFLELQEKNSQLQALAEDKMKYRHVYQAQINKLTDVFAARMKAGQPTDDILQKSSVDDVRAIIYHNAAALRMLRKFRFINTQAVSTMIETFIDHILNAELLVGMLTLRSAVEHIAHYLHSISKIRERRHADGYETANINIHRIIESLIKSMYGMRVKAEALFDIRLLGSKRDYKYSEMENRVNLLASSILSDIDYLEKHVRGVRGIYEALCEFSHPNHGVQYAFIKKYQKPTATADGVYWITQDLEINSPFAFFNEAENFITGLFEIINKLFDRYLEEIASCDKLLDDVQKMVQMVVANGLKAHPSLIPRNSACPCESGLKVKRCCGLSQ